MNASTSLFFAGLRRFCVLMAITSLLFGVAAGCTGEETGGDGETDAGFVDGGDAEGGEDVDDDAGDTDAGSDVDDTEVDAGECSAIEDCEAGHRCLDNSCVAVDLRFGEQPYGGAVAGEPFAVTVELVEDDGMALALEGIEVTVEPNQHEFAAGPEVTEQTGEDGIATFDLVLDVVDDDYELVATADAEGFDGTTAVSEPFDIVESVSGCDPTGIQFGGGDGTEESPHLICSPMQLVEIGTNSDYWDRNFELADDLDVSDVDVLVIGHGEESTEDRFEGRFDGAGHVIEGLSIEEPDEQFVGLFGYVDEGAVVEDVTVEGINVEGEHEVGGIAGRSEGELRDVEAGGEVDGAGWHVGGMVGYNGGLVSSSVAHVDVTGGDREVGGLVGTNTDDATVETSSAHGEVVGTDEDVGGLVGLNDGVVERSYAAGDAEGVQYVGGLAGSNRGEGTANDSYATGEVDGDEQVGGLVGSHRSYFSDSPAISRCYATGVAAGDIDVGGLVGEVDGGDVSYSYWDDETGGPPNDAGQPLSTTEFDDKESFDDWDFEDVWEIGDVPDGEKRPILQWQAGD